MGTDGLFGGRKGSGQDETYGNMIRYGKVSSVNAKLHTVRVAFPDKGDLVSHSLPVLVPGSLKNRYYSLPDVGEDVLCLFLPNGAQRGFVLGSFYSVNNPPPVTSQDKRYITFPDGTVVEYDRAAHRLTVDVKGDIRISATGGDVIVNGVSLVQHTHGGVQPGGGSTAPPER